jgi:GH43 family beta-xylosidase
MLTRLFEKRKLNVLLGCALITLSTHLWGQTFQNPIRAGAADPAMVYYNGFYYLTYSNGPRVDIVKSATIAGLSTTTATTVWTDSDPIKCCFMWAPALKLLNKPDGSPGEKRWYLYYVAADYNTGNFNRNYVLESSGLDPMGPYTFKSRLHPTNEDARSIDPNILEKDDGSLYYLWSSGSNNEISIASMSNPWTVNGAKVIISTPTYAWEKVGAWVNENPAAVKRNGKTYITYSASTCFSPDYCTGMLVNTDGNYLNPGSWSKIGGPVLFKSAVDGVYGPGGVEFFKSPDGLEDWIVYHATTASSGECNGNRNGRIQKITWDNNDNPIFCLPPSSSTSLYLPSGDAGANPLNNKTIISGLTYKLTHKGTNQVLDVANNSGASGANVQQWTDIASDAQKWVVTLQPDSTYKLLHKYTNMALSSLSNGAGAGIDVVQETEAGLDGQRWKIQLQPNGYYKLVRKGTSNICLDVSNNSATPGANVLQWTDNGVDAQRWRMEVVGEVITGATYKLLHKGTNQYLASQNNSNAAGADVLQLTGNSDLGQQWVVTVETGGYYKLTRKGTGICLDVSNNSGADGANVLQWTDNGGDGQRWSMVHVSDGYYKLVHKGTNKCLDVAGNSSSAGANVQQWTDNGAYAQLWQLQLVTLPNGQIPMFAAPNTKTQSIELRPGQSLNVYPNPSGSSVTIYYVQDVTSNANVSLYKSSGGLVKNIFTGVLNKNEVYKFEISKGALGSGVYFIKAYNDKNVQATKIIFK